MDLIKGITVTLMEKVQTGSDPFGAPIWKETPVEVENVLVSPSNPQEMATALDLTGKKAVYTLGIPKGDTHDWQDKEIRFFSQSFKSFGFVLEGIEANVPTAWHKKVMVERFGT